MGAADSAGSVAFEAALRPVASERDATAGTAEAAADSAEAAAVAAKAAEASDGWDAFTDPESGGVWYYNSHTGEASWNKPPPSKPAASSGGQSSELCHKSASISPAQKTAEWL